MDDDRLVTSSGFVVTPETIATRTFTTAFRGFDHGEVRAFLKRVSAELEAAAEREAQLRHLLQEAQNRAAHPELDEHVLTAALGEQAGRLLASAREQAASIRAEAEEKASRKLRETEGQISRIRSEADSLLARRVEEVDGVTANLRNAAEADAKALREQAKTDSEAEIQAAKAQGREMVAEAKAVRERILADLARRRHISEVQLDQLRAARERLLEAYGLVRRTLDEATQELKMAEVEARLAAEEAGRRAGPPPPPPPPLSTDDSGPGSGRHEVVVADPPPVSEPAASVPAGRSGSTRLRPSRESAPRTEPRLRPPGRPGEARPSPPWRRPPESPSPPRPERRMDAPAVARGGSSGESGARPAPEAPLSPPPVQPPSMLPRAVPPPPARGTGRPAPPSDRATSDEGDRVNELFARIKADRASDLARMAPAPPPEPSEAAADDVPAPPASAEPSTPAEESASPAPPAAHAAPVHPDKPRSVTDEAARAQRDALLEPAEATLVRQLKRALQDEQNEVLDQLRRKRSPKARPVLPPPSEHLERFRDAASSALAEAARAGYRFADPASDGAGTDPATAAEVAATLATLIVEPLRERLNAYLGGPSDDAASASADDGARIAESVSAVYR
ncbi:MAG: DivIVA domain-containing protein, partial [Actinobacteria bacterium]|nr:DivIVA domain-containing protein [Actinomycetota bacterium]